VVLTNKGVPLTTAADILVVNDLKIVNKTLLTIMLVNTAIARIRGLHPWYWEICKAPNRFVSIATNRAILRRIVSSCETIFLKVGEDVEMDGTVDEEMGGEMVVAKCV
jgi:hypothetical protein